MSDPTQFIVNFWAVHRLLIHEGIMATGRDLLSQSPCSLHSYSDKYKRTYTMQMFDSVDSNFISNHINSLSKSCHSTSLPNLIRPVLITTRKTSKTNYELAVFYDTQGIGESTLAELIKAKRTSNETFESDELSAFFWQLADFFILSGSRNSEYLDISPINIYCKIDGFYGYNFFLSNYGRQNSKEPYHNPSDQFHKGQRTHENALSAAMFSFGMILLEMATMLPSQELYSSGVISQKLLQKRIEGAKIKCDKMISSVLGQLLQLDQAKRIKGGEIFKNDEWLKLRKVAYFQSKVDFFQYRNFQGIMEYDKRTSIGEALDQNLSMLRGTFINGVFEGRGVQQNGNTLEAGIFMAGQLVQGQITTKNSHIDIGKFKNGVILQGLRLFLNISCLSKQGRILVGFSGEFQGGEPKTGSFLFNDGSEEVL